MKLSRHVTIKLNTKNLDRVVGDDGGVYVGYAARKCLALDPGDYHVRWEMKAKGYVPVFAAGNIVVLGSDWAKGGLRGVDALTGAARWTRETGTGVWRCFAWRNGLFRYPAGVGVEHIVDPATGQIVEEISFDLPTTLLGESHALLWIGELAGRCIELATRRVLWERRVFDLAREAAGASAQTDTWLGGAFFHPPGTVVVQQGSGFAAFALDSGDMLWTAALPVEPDSYVTTDLGCVVATSAREMIAFDVNDGSVRWIRARPDLPPDVILPGRYQPPRHVFKGMFLSHEHDGLYLIDPASGQTVASAPGVTFADVAVVGDKLLAVRDEGRLNVFSMDSRPLPKAPRPAPPPKVIKAKVGTLAFEEIALVKLPGLRWPSRAILTADAAFISDSENGVIKVARDGWRIDWQKPPGTPEIVWVAGGVAIAPLARRGRIAAFRTSDGAPAWESASQRGQAWLLDDHRVVVAPAGSGPLRVLELDTGQVLQTIERTLPRVVGAADGRVALSSFSPAPDDLLEALQMTPDEPGVDRAMAEAYLDEDDAAVADLAQGMGHRFAVIDVDEGRTIWSSELQPRLKEMAGLDVRLALEVVGVTAQWLLLWHISPQAGSHLWGVSMVTGAVAWHARLGPGPPGFDGAYVWMPLYLEGFDCVDIHTGAVKRRHSPKPTPTDPRGSYGPYYVASNTKRVDFYHPEEESQRLDLDNGVQVLLGAPPELLLVERERLRVFRAHDQAATISPSR